VFYSCANWPACEWVSWYRPLTEPCPQCGGIQVDMGKGRVRCLKHEGEPPRFAARTNGAAAADGSTDEADAENGARAKPTRRPAAKTARTVAAKSANGTARTTAASKATNGTGRTSAAGKRANGTARPSAAASKRAAASSAAAERTTSAAAKSVNGAATKRTNGAGATAAAKPARRPAPKKP
jgi:hypothetical protein